MPLKSAVEIPTAARNRVRFFIYYFLCTTEDILCHSGRHSGALFLSRFRLNYLRRCFFGSPTTAADAAAETSPPESGRRAPSSLTTSEKTTADTSSLVAKRVTPQIHLHKGFGEPVACNRPECRLVVVRGLSEDENKQIYVR